jgi:hypothetical protein
MSKPKAFSADEHRANAAALRKHAQHPKLKLEQAATLRARANWHEKLALEMANRSVKHAWERP